MSETTHFFTVTSHNDRRLKAELNKFDNKRTLSNAVLELHGGNRISTH